MVLFDILNKNDYEFYAGAGVKTKEFEGFVVPVGVNIFPLETKKLAFYIDLAPIFGDYEIRRES